MTVDAVTSAITRTVLPAVPVTFDHAGSIDETLHAEYIDWMARQSVGGVTIWAHTGRGLLLRPDERSYVLSQWREKLPDRPLICGAGVPVAAPLPVDPSARTQSVCKAAWQMGNEAKQGGADALLVYPPTPLRGLPDFAARIVEYHTAVSEVGLPLVAFFLYDAAGGISYDTAVLDAICSLDNFIGIKIATLDSVMTFQDVVAHVNENHGNTLIITGEDRFLGYSYAMGASAALIGIAAVATDHAVALSRNWFARDFDAFHKLSQSMDAFARATFRAPMEAYVQRILWALEADGVLSRRAYDRYAPEVIAAERSAVFDALLKLRAA